MDTIKLRDPELRKKYSYLVENYYSKMPKSEVYFSKMVIVNFKKNSSNEELIILILLYGLLYFKQIQIDDDLISQENKLKILKLKNLLDLETK